MQLSGTLHSHLVEEHGAHDGEDHYGYIKGGKVVHILGILSNVRLIIHVLVHPAKSKNINILYFRKK